MRRTSLNISGLTAHVQEQNDRIQRIWDLLTTEFGLTAEQVKAMLMDDPRLFIMGMLIGSFILDFSRPDK